MKSFRLRINELFLEIIFVVPMGFQKLKSVAVSFDGISEYERTAHYKTLAVKRTYLC